MLTEQQGIDIHYFYTKLQERGIGLFSFKTSCGKYITIEDTDLENEDYFGYQSPNEGEERDEEKGLDITDAPLEEAIADDPECDNEITLDLTRLREPEYFEAIVAQIHHEPDLIQPIEEGSSDEGSGQDLGLQGGDSKMGDGDN